MGEDGGFLKIAKLVVDKAWIQRDEPEQEEEEEEDEEEDEEDGDYEVIT